MEDIPPSGIDALDALCRRHHVRQLDIFGSATTERFDRDRSDVDFLVAFAPLEAASYAGAFFALHDGLREIFGRNVDLVTDASLANPYFRAQVESERQTLFRQS